MTTKFEISEGLEKALALKTFLGEDYFLLEGVEVRAFEGTEQEASEQFAEYRKSVALKTDEEEMSFYEWACENLTEIEEITDDERDGYMVLTDEEADEKAKYYILDSVWAFTPSSLSDFTGFDIEVFEAIQNNGRCESNNSAILSMIKDEQDFVEQAISADGRGHFLSSYDGNENEQRINDTTYFIYRMN